MNNRIRVSHGTRRRTIAAIAAVVVLAGAVVTTVVLLRPTPGARPAAASTTAPQSPAQTAPLGPSAPISSHTAGAAVGSFLSQVAAITPAMKNIPSRLKSVASGAIIGSIEDQEQELKVNGWTQHGTPTLSKVKVTASDLNAAVPTATVQACVDSSTVTTLDSDGKPLVRSGGASGQRAINIYGLQRIDGHWRVVSQTFPDNPAC